MKMNEIEVSDLGGEILISQTQYDNTKHAVAITPEQADLVCKWILRAAQELLAEE